MVNNYYVTIFKFGKTVNKQTDDPAELARRPANKAAIRRSDDPAITRCLNALYIFRSILYGHQVSCN